MPRKKTEHRKIISQRQLNDRTGNSFKQKRIYFSNKVDHVTIIPIKRGSYVAVSTLCWYSAVSYL